MSTRCQASSSRFGGGEGSSLGGRGPPWSMLALCAARRATPPQLEPRAFCPKCRSGFSTPCPGRWLFPSRPFDGFRRSRSWLLLRDRAGPFRLPLLLPWGCFWSLRPVLRGRPLRLFTNDHGTASTHKELIDASSIAEGLTTKGPFQPCSSDCDEGERGPS